MAETGEKNAAASAPMRATLGRADLLRLLLNRGQGLVQIEENELGLLGQLCGYAYDSSAAPEVSPAPLPVFQTTSSPPQLEQTAPVADACQLRVPQYHAQVSSLRSKEETARQIQALQAVLDLPPPPAPPASAPAPDLVPLASRRRLVRLAEQYLRRPRAGRKLDMLSLVRALANCQQLQPRRLRRLRADWRGNALLLSLNKADEPLRADYYRLARTVYARAGGLVPIFLHLQGHGWFQKCSAASDEREWHAVPGADAPKAIHGLHALAVGRMPPLLPASVHLRALFSAGYGEGAEFGAGSIGKLSSTGDKTGDNTDESAPETHRPPALPASLIAWHEAHPLHARRTWPAWQVGEQARFKDLLTLLSLTSHVDTRLLRALRQLLGLPPTAEAACWEHGEMANIGHAICIAPAHRAAYQKQLTALPLTLRQQAARLIARHHPYLSFAIQLDDANCAARYAPGAEAFDPAPWYAQWARHLCAQGNDGLSREAQEQAAYLRRQGWRSAGALWEQSAFALAWAWAERTTILQEQPLPGELPVEVLEDICAALKLSAAPSASRLWRVLQVHDQAQIYYSAADAKPERFAPELARWVGGPRLQWRQGDGEWQNLVATPEEGECCAQLPLAQPLELRDGQQLCRIEEIEEPSWAVGMGRDQKGVYALAAVLWGEALRIDLPLVADGRGMLFEERREFQAKIGKKAKKRKTFHLTQSLRCDEIGLVARLHVHSPYGEAEQDFRWIVPGSFLMGRPEEEDGYGDEVPRHKVEISRGFWLADTACTQALWQAVLSNNPARFSEENGGSPMHPVERVSWMDVQQFLNQINTWLGEGVASLPTEAEWEYACRAGTQTPFSFGATVSIEQVNYNGKYTYDGARKGEYREKTVAVKALPANHWGLYEMHANVWEWCADGLRHYGAKTVRDPGLQEALAPPAGREDMGRVLRGGSWSDFARSARSASRSAAAAGFRNVGIGFRLALRFQAGRF